MIWYCTSLGCLDLLTYDFLFVSSPMLKGGSGTSESLNEGEFPRLVSEPDRDENLASLRLGLDVGDGWDDSPCLAIVLME